ncbi:MAG: TetR/AcrR family transcriptional regulator [Rariglobus sp.]
MSSHTSPPRDRILAAAGELFYREGLRGVGVERIAAVAETTKMALYRHFSSKDELIGEWLSGIVRYYDDLWKQIESEHPDDPKMQLHALGAWTVGRCTSPESRGCALVNSLAELPDPSHPARKIIDAHKVAQLQRVEKLCRRAGLPDPAGTALALHIAFEGAQVAAQSLGRERVAKSLRKIVDAQLARSE